jgi:archaetidylinositol phosphate synthase
MASYGKGRRHSGDEVRVRVRREGAVSRTPIPSGAEIATTHVRVNRGLLAEPERRALRWLAERTPSWMKPDHLTAIGVFGAVLTMVGLAAATFSPRFVLLAWLGLFLNWYGDSLDGTLARYRRVERPQLGYFTDHACDLISQTLIFVGLGLSPYFTLFSALLALSMYLLISSYTYLKVMVLGNHQLSYGGMGATELRVAIACWALLAIRVRPSLTVMTFANHPLIDEIIGAMWAVVFLSFIWMVCSDLAAFRTALEERDGAEP